MSRDFDVVVLGATGVTARRVAEYLAKRGARWAAAARDAAKTERVLGEIGVRAPEIITVDVGDAAALSEMVSRSKVVVNGVGPYGLYARPVIEACIDSGTHYTDYTGEIPFVREIVRELNDRAASNGAKIVQVAGFESLPPDLAVRLAAENARERWDRPLEDVELRGTLRPPPGMVRPSDGMSGGTMQSIAALLERDDASVATDPAALVFEDAIADEIRRISPISTRVRSGGDGTVIAPMIPAAFINPAIIHRSALLSGEAPFSYREGIAMTGPAARLLAGSLSAFQALMSRSVRWRPSTRQRVANGLRRILPSSGYGPAPDRLEDWGWHMVVHARTEDGHTVTVDVDGDGHPGYLATARMIGEAALLLAEDGATPVGAGCLTPSVALGTGCVDRFAHAGVRFRVRADA